MISIKDIVALQRDKKSRERVGAFFVDGVNMVKQAIEKDWPIKQLVVVDELVDNEYKKEILAKIDHAKIMHVDKRNYEKLATKKMIQGMGAVVEFKKQNFRDGIIVVLENPRDPGNLGTIMRSMLAMGCFNLIIVKPCTDIHHPETIRASMGAILHMRIVLVENLVEAFSMVASLNYQNLVFDKGKATARLKEKANTISRMDKKAIWFGNEGAGVSEAVLNKNNPIIAIETSSDVDSLNLAEAVSIGLYTLLKP